jgi:hypothetical protein
MKCYCCDDEVDQAYHVKLRGDVSAAPAGRFPSPTDPAYLTYCKQATFRSAFVCARCYAILDSDDGTGAIGGRAYGISGRSRCGQAALYNETKYRAFQRRQAGRMGMELD